jgi:hypothetical protein
MDNISPNNLDEGILKGLKEKPIDDTVIDPPLDKIMKGAPGENMDIGVP